MAWKEVMTQGDNLHTPSHRFTLFHTVSENQLPGTGVAVLVNITEIHNNMIIFKEV